MPSRYRQEVLRIMRRAHAPSECDLDEVTLLLTELRDDAERAGHATLAELIGFASDEATRLRHEPDLRVRSRQPRA